MKQNGLKEQKSVLNGGTILYHIMNVRLITGRMNNIISYKKCQIDVWTNEEWKTILDMPEGRLDEGTVMYRVRHARSTITFK